MPRRNGDRMKGQTILGVLLLVSLAGCFGSPEPPEDAATDQRDGLPGLTLYAWTVDVGGRTRMHALVENDGPHNYDIFVACGEPWRSRIIGPDGQDVHFIEVLEEPGCAKYRDVLRPNGDIDVLYSWNYRDHDVRNSTSTPVAPGMYEWVLQFTLRESEQFLEVRVPIQVVGDDDGPLAAFSMQLKTGTVPNGHGVNVTVHNGGSDNPDFWTGCSMEWSVRVLDSDGDEVPVDWGGNCAGFINTVFPAGSHHYAEFFWNGTTPAGDAYHVVPAGQYFWEVSFGLKGTGDDVLTKRAAFTV